MRKNTISKKHGETEIRFGEIISDSSQAIPYRFSYLVNHFQLPVYSIFLKEVGISRPEYGALYCIYFQPGAYAKDIASILGHPKNTVSRAINLLATKGLLKKELDNDDNRCERLIMTDKGKELFETLTINLDKRQKQLLQNLTKKEVEQLDSILNKLTAEVQSWPSLKKEDLLLPDRP